MTLNRNGTQVGSLAQERDTAAVNTWNCRVLSVQKSERLPVYNLTVADNPQFFANGVLVHNCDAVSGAYSLLWTIAGEIKPVKTAEEIRQEFINKHYGFHEPEYEEDYTD
jgi:hypothetical protein